MWLININNIEKKIINDFIIDDASICKDSIKFL